VDLSSTAGELYALMPGEFVAARTAAEKKARAAGDRELAGQIHALAKPTAAAWIANQLVRRHPDEIAGLRELGTGLREATAGLEGEQLRQLSQQQNRVISALVGQARSLAKAAGQPMSEATERGLEATLRAALADEDLADQLASGQLTVALEHSGFGELSGIRGAISSDAVPKPAPAPSRRDDLAERRRRREKLEQARGAVREARAAEREANAALERAETAVRDAERDRDGAKAAAQAAAERLQAAQDELEQLND
jgi:hypothetical protein